MGRARERQGSQRAATASAAAATTTTTATATIATAAAAEAAVVFLVKEGSCFASLLNYIYRCGLCTAPQHPPPPVLLSSPSVWRQQLQPAVFWLLSKKRRGIASLFLEDRDSACVRPLSLFFVSRPDLCTFLLFFHNSSWNESLKAKARARKTCLHFPCGSQSYSPPWVFQFINS